MATFASPDLRAEAPLKLEEIQQVLAQTIAAAVERETLPRDGREPADHLRGQTEI